MLRNTNIEVVQAWIHIHIPGEPGNEAIATGIVKCSRECSMVEVNAGV